MSAAEAAPPPEHDPASPSVTVDAPDQEKKDHKPRDSKGWDGKLRLSKKANAGEEAADDPQSEAEESPDEGPPPEQISADEDLLDDYLEDEEEIDLVHRRVSSIPALKLERFKKLKVTGLSIATLDYG